MPLRHFPAYALIAALLASCAWTQHNVAVTAMAPAERSSVGDGVTVALQVIDDREDVIVGQRAIGGVGADITARALVQSVQTELRRGLRSKGFRVVSPGRQSDAELEARIRGFKFYLERGFFTSGENVSVAIAVEAERRGRDYSQTYRSNDEDRGMFIPSGSDIDAQLNDALAHVYSQILNDKALLSFMAR